MEPISAVEDFLTCPVCLETFKEPVSLGCNHSFCSSCLHDYWDKNSTKNCPVCRRRSSKDLLIVNFALKLRSQHQALAQRREQASALQRQYEEINLHTQTQVKACERQIRDRFERLHRFLQQEEESTVKVLREEQSRQAQTIEPQLQKIREELSTLEQNILTVEEQMKRQSLDFFREYRHTHQTTQTLPSQPDPELGPGLLINLAKVLGNMGFKVWEKMRALVHYSPVLLDPNTAHGRLYLSEDLRGVRHGDTEQQIPLNPERFTKCADVLGCEGFSSGSQQWDVEVGDHPHWIIGLAKESVDRKGNIFADPEHGRWCLGLVSGEYSDVVGKTLNLKRSPQKIRVRLDYDEGKLSFYDAEDMSLICSHEERFTEKMFPYFSVGKAGHAKTKEIKINCNPLSIHSG